MGFGRQRLMQACRVQYALRIQTQFGAHRAEQDGPAGIVLPRLVRGARSQTREQMRESPGRLSNQIRKIGRRYPFNLFDDR